MASNHVFLWLLRKMKIKKMKNITIFNNISWNFLKGFLQFLLMIIIVRSLSISDYGWYVATIAGFELVVIFCLPGVIRIALRSSLSVNSRFEHLFGLRVFLLPLLLFGFIFTPEGKAVFILLATASDQISMFARVKLNQHRQYLIHNGLESFKPFTVIVAVIFYTVLIDKDLSLDYLIQAYCYLSVINMILNIWYAKKYASFTLKILNPSKTDFIESIYSSGNGLISTCMRRGMVLVAAYSFSTADAAYVNIALQFLTIFTMLYSGMSLSLTRDIYDVSLSINKIKVEYFRPLLLLIFSIISGSLLLYFFGDLVLVTILGEAAIGAAPIVFLTPLIFLLQLPQLLLMGVFMRFKQEFLILGLNIFSIVIFIPIAFFLATSVNNLMFIALNFSLFTSLVYLVAFRHSRIKNKYVEFLVQKDLSEN
jgi:O-antigen/teichoic acid export membrane protein